MQEPEIEIEKIILRRVAIPLHEPFRISNGEVATKESVIVELHSGGVIGYGEASPMPGSFYSNESPDSTWRALADDLVPYLLQRTLENPVEYAEALNAYEREPFARAGIEGAVWDLTALRLNTSIGALLGVTPRSIESGLALGLYDTIEELVERANKHLPHGYKRLKIKIKPGWDIEPLKALRKDLSDFPMMVDANASYNLAEHIKVLKELDRFGLLMIEQPLAKDAFADMATLSSMIATPICADESAESLEDLAEIIRLKSASIINIKVQRVGGLWNAKQMYERASEAGLQLWLGTMPELGIATAQALQLASLPGFGFPTDIEPSDRWFTDDIVTPKITMDAEGLIHLPAGPGFGYSVDLIALDRYTTSMEEFVR
jgi:O-succinylbenzoate synthase